MRIASNQIQAYLEYESGLAYDVGMNPIDPVFIQADVRVDGVMAKHVKTALDVPLPVMTPQKLPMRNKIVARKGLECPLCQGTLFLAIIQALGCYASCIRCNHKHHSFCRLLG